MVEILVPIVAIVCIFVIFPGIVFDFIVKIKKARSLSSEDEKIMDDMDTIARRLEERLITIERILDAENPSWRGQKR
jgi:phage shock protein B